MSTQPLTPADLPQAKAQFIAYGAPTRAAHPKTGDPVTIRPQTFVRYYTDILVKEVKRGGRNGGDTVAVHFDPESVGLKENITAYLDTDDPLVPMLEQAQQNGTPVDAALESARRPKAKSNKALISPLAHIHALRGASTPDGAKGPEMMSKSGENIRNLLAMVNGQPSKGIVSDPREWSLLVDNKSGDLPPEGWRNFAVGEAWEDCGAAIPSDEAPRSMGAQAGPAGALAGMSPDDLRKFLGGIVNDVLEFREKAAAGAGPDRPNARNASTRFESQPWVARTSDGRIALGSYPVSAYGFSYRWAWETLTTQGSQDVAGQVGALTHAFLDIADEVQVRSYAGLVDSQRQHPVVADRAAASHTEARRWVEWAIEHMVPFDLSVGPTAEWMEQVAVAATERLVEAGRAVAANLSAKRPSPQPAQPHQGAPSQQGAQTSPEEGPSQPAQGGGSPAGGASAVEASPHQAFLDRVAQSWTSLDAIRSAGQEAKRVGIMDLPVSLNASGAVPVLSHPPVPGESHGGLGALLRSRWETLSSAPQAQPQQGQGQPAPPPQDTPTPRPVPAAYTPAVQGTIDAIRSLNGAPTLDAVRAIADQARQNGAISETVSVVNLGAAPSFGPADADGEKHTLAEVLDALRQSAESTAPQHQEEPQATPAPASAPQAQGQGQGQGQDTQEKSPAQVIAERAESATTVAEMESLRAEAEQAGLLNAQVTMEVKGRVATGPLDGYLTTLLRRPPQG